MEKLKSAATRLQLLQSLLNLFFRSDYNLFQDSRSPVPVHYQTDVRRLSSVKNCLGLTKKNPINVVGLCYRNTILPTQIFFFVKSQHLDRHPNGDLMIPPQTFSRKKKFNHLPFAFCLLPFAKSEKKSVQSPNDK